MDEKDKNDIVALIKQKLETSYSVPLIKILTDFRERKQQLDENYSLRITGDLMEDISRRVTNEGKYVFNIYKGNEYHISKKAVSENDTIQDKLAKLQFEDFPKSIRRAKWATIISIVSLLATIVLGLLQLKCN